LLAWLHNALLEYEDRQKAYADVVNALSRERSLRPRMEAYTAENGTSSLLLVLAGTLKVNVKGVFYHFPVSLWVPRLYPHEPPLVYVTPRQGTTIQPGHHVAVDGRVCHPYLRDWGQSQGRASIVEFLDILTGVLEHEQPINEAGPPLPPKGYNSDKKVAHSQGLPPPRPPKPWGARQQTEQVEARYRAPLPLPSQVLPQQIPQWTSLQRQQRYLQSPQQLPLKSHSGLPTHYFSFYRPEFQSRLFQLRADSPQYPRPNSREIHSSDVSHRARKAPQDLLSDAFEKSQPVVENPIPPIAPNPEKERLLQLLSTSFAAQARSKVDQAKTAASDLQAQAQALTKAQSRLESELAFLESLSLTLDANERILHQAIADCERTAQLAGKKPEPPIDEILLAPTTVENQLWSLCADEAACREAMGVLLPALDRGRISTEVFVKQMRALSREAFQKMALARKCAHRLGLD
ncbi:UEV-domain-containing protein, partial [Piedraia hortae CBS 480.64]